MRHTIWPTAVIRSEGRRPEARNRTRPGREAFLPGRWRFLASAPCGAPLGMTSPGDSSPSLGMTAAKLSDSLYDATNECSSCFDQEQLFCHVSSRCDRLVRVGPRAPLPSGSASERAGPATSAGRGHGVRRSTGLRRNTSGRRETGDGRRETGDGRRETGDGGALSFRAERRKARRRGIAISPVERPHFRDDGDSSPPACGLRSE